MAKLIYPQKNGFLSIINCYAEDYKDIIEDFGDDFPKSYIVLDADYNIYAKEGDDIEFRRADNFFEVSTKDKDAIVSFNMDNGFHLKLSIEEHQKETERIIEDIKLVAGFKELKLTPELIEKMRSEMYYRGDNPRIIDMEQEEPYNPCITMYVSSDRNLAGTMVHFMNIESSQYQYNYDTYGESEYAEELKEDLKEMKEVFSLIETADLGVSEDAKVTLYESGCYDIEAILDGENVYRAMDEFLTNVNALEIANKEKLYIYETFRNVFNSDNWEYNVKDFDREIFDSIINKHLQEIGRRLKDFDTMSNVSIIYPGDNDTLEMVNFYRLKACDDFIKYNDIKSYIIVSRDDENALYEKSANTSYRKDAQNITVTVDGIRAIYDENLELETNNLVKTHFTTSLEEQIATATDIVTNNDILSQNGDLTMNKNIAIEPEEIEVE